MDLKINPLQVLKDYEGKPIKAGKENYTLRNAITIAINAENEKNRLAAEKKNKAFQISTKMYASDKQVNLTDDDRVFIKERALIFHSPLITGRITEIFENKEK